MIAILAGLLEALSDILVRCSLTALRLSLWLTRKQRYFAEPIFDFLKVTMPALSKMGDPPGSVDTSGNSYAWILHWLYGPEGALEYREKGELSHSAKRIEQAERAIGAAQGSLQGIEAIFRIKEVLGEEIDANALKSIRGQVGSGLSYLKRAGYSTTLDTVIEVVTFKCATAHNLVDVGQIGDITAAITRARGRLSLLERRALVIIEVEKTDP
jgi:hypothetical protein